MSEVHTYIETLKKIGINGIQIIQDGQEIGCFMKKEYKIAGDILLELGFSEEDFYLSPSFSLMQKDEV